MRVLLRTLCGRCERRNSEPREEQDEQRGMREESCRFDAKPAYSGSPEYRHMNFVHSIFASRLRISRPAPSCYHPPVLSLPHP